MTAHNSYEPPEERYTPGPTEEDVSEREAVEAVEGLSFQQLELAVARYIQLATPHALEDTRSRILAEITQQLARSENDARVLREIKKRMARSASKDRSDKGLPRGPRVRRAS